MKAAERAHYDAILMDCHMPGVDGFEATTRIRTVVGDRIPIIAFTANALPGDRQRCLAAGMNDYVPKPVRADRLQEILDRWVPRRSDPPNVNRRLAS